MSIYLMATLTDPSSFKVRLVQKTDTGKIYAMKTLKKEEMLKKDQVCTSNSHKQCGIDPIDPAGSCTR